MTVASAYKSPVGKHFYLEIKYHGRRVDCVSSVPESPKIEKMRNSRITFQILNVPQKCAWFLREDFPKLKNRVN